MKLIHKVTMNVNAPLDSVAAWIMTPDKVLQYAPAPIDGGIFREGEQFWIRLKSGVSLVEKLNAESNANRVTVKVTVSPLKTVPNSADEIEGQRMLCFFEDWHLEATESGTRIVKVWRDLEKHKMRWMPFAWLIRRSVKKDVETLQRVWSEA